MNYDCELAEQIVTKYRVLNLFPCDYYYTQVCLLAIFMLIVSHDVNKP